MPVEQGLEFMAVVSADRRDAEGELLDHVVDEVHGVLLRVAGIDLQRADAGRVVDSRVLVAPHGLAGSVGEV